MSKEVTEITLPLKWVKETVMNGLIVFNRLVIGTKSVGWVSNRQKDEECEKDEFILVYFTIKDDKVLKTRNFEKVYDNLEEAKANLINLLKTGKYL